MAELAFPSYATAKRAELGFAELLSTTTEGAGAGAGGAGGAGSSKCARLVRIELPPALHRREGRRRRRGSAMGRQGACEKRETENPPRLNAGRYRYTKSRIHAGCSSLVPPKYLCIIPVRDHMKYTPGKRYNCSVTINNTIVLVKHIRNCVSRVRELTWLLAERAP